MSAGSMHRHYALTIMLMVPSEIAELQWRRCAGPYTRGPTVTFATRDLVAKVKVGPWVYGPPGIIICIVIK